MSGLSRSRSPRDEANILGLDRGGISQAIAKNLMPALNSVRGPFAAAAHNLDRGGHEQHFDHS